jgi:hypothetical protein
LYEDEDEDEIAAKETTMKFVAKLGYLHLARTKKRHYYGLHKRNWMTITMLFECSRQLALLSISLRNLTFSENKERAVWYGVILGMVSRSKAQRLVGKIGKKNPLAALQAGVFVVPILQKLGNYVFLFHILFHKCYAFSSSYFAPYDMEKLWLEPFFLEVEEEITTDGTGIFENYTVHDTIELMKEEEFVPKWSELKDAAANPMRAPQY